MSYAQIVELSTNLHRLTGSDYNFASSLIDQNRRRGYLSDKQLYWVGKLVEKAKAPAPTTIALTADFARIIELFNGAGGKLPKLFLATPTGTVYRLTKAGASARVPGSINVVRKAGGLWIGRIHSDGKFVASPRISGEFITEATGLIQAFGADPEGVAAKYGTTCKACCFCGLTLTDPRSKEVGYGPDCAKRWKLKWGSYDPTTVTEVATKAFKPRAAKVEEEEEAFAIW